MGSRPTLDATLRRWPSEGLGGPGALVSTGRVGPSSWFLLTAPVERKGSRPSAGTSVPPDGSRRRADARCTARPLTPRGWRASSDVSVPQSRRSGCLPVPRGVDLEIQAGPGVCPVSHVRGSSRCEVTGRENAYDGTCCCRSTDRWLRSRLRDVARATGRCRRKGAVYPRTTLSRWALTR